MYIFMGIKSLAVFIGIFYILIDRFKFMGLLNLSNKQKFERENKLNTTIFESSELHYRNKYVNIGGIVFNVIMVVSACK